MAVDEVLVSVSPGEARAAFLERGRLLRFVIDRGGEQPRVGDIILGRVTKVFRGTDAAFVTIGHDRQGYLPLAGTTSPGRHSGKGSSRTDRLPSRPQRLSEGDPVLVQLVREAEGTKIAKLSRRPVLAGYRLALAPSDEASDVAGDDERPGVAESAVRPDQREQALAIAARLPPAPGRWIVHEAALHASEAELAGEAAALCRRWQRVRERRGGAVPPARLEAGPSPIIAALGEEASPTLQRIVVDDPAMAETLRTALAGAGPEIETSMREDLFAHAGVEEQVEAALSPVAPLACGGAIILSPTPAVIAVDVDTGGADQGGREATALAVNLEAADELLRQIRLRGLGGHLVIDFVPMRRRANTDKVLRRLRNGLAHEGGDAAVAGYTRLGLVEITRRRRGPSLADLLLDPCPTCHGGGRLRSPVTVALDALRTVLREDRARPGRAWRLEAAAPVAAALRGEAAAALDRTEERLGRPLRLAVYETLAADAVRITEDREQPG